MPDFPQDEVAQPDEPFWARPLQLNFKGFFANLGKATTLATLGIWDEAAASALDAAAAIGVTRTPSQLAGALLQRAMTRATFHLLRDYVVADFSEQLDDKVQQVGEQMEREIAERPIQLHLELFDHPRDIPLVGLFQKRLANWLACRQVGDHRAETIAARLPSYFVYALHQEFRENKIDYAPLARFIDSFAAKAWSHERTWHAYQRAFEQELDEPLFGEAFSLPQIFLWPNACFVKRARGASDGPFEGPGPQKPDGPAEAGPEQRFVVDLKEALDAWLEQDEEEKRRQHDTIRLVSGDPGSGKSAFARMYALHRMKRGDRVLVVPLHRLNVLDDLAQSLEAYCRERDACPMGLLDAETAEKRLLLVLDGLDELSKQGRMGAMIASAFVDEVMRKVDARNERELRVQVLISGRPIAVQNVADKFRREGQVFHLLPYYVSEEDREERKHEYEYVGHTDRLKTDLRQQWWSDYGELKGFACDGLPAELSGTRLDDLTSQPLLNFLVALVYRRGKVDFTKKVNRNEIYDDLLDRVYERDWDPAKAYKALGGIERDDFRDLLKEMALTAWHDRERTTTERAVRDRCAGTSLEDVLSRYEARGAEGVGQLFTAFYFRRSPGVVGPEPTFEFTHKSFAEYLTACRIVDAVKIIHEDFADRETKRRRSEDVWTEKDALLRWLKVCGPAEVSIELMGFVRNEVRFRAEHREADVPGWQRTLVRLIDESLAGGMPCEKLEGGLPFQEMARRARNADEALLVLHSCCAYVTHRLSPIEWPTPVSAGEWIGRLRGQRSGPGNVAALYCLDHLDLTSQQLDFRDLYGAYLVHACMRATILYGATLYGADLQGANLQEAGLQLANLQRADLQGADLRLADLELADLQVAKLQLADLRGAILQRADLEGADLREADLRGAVLQAAHLQEAHLEGAQLQGANLEGADLSNAKITKAQLAQTHGTPVRLPDGTSPTEKSD